MHIFSKEYENENKDERVLRIDGVIESHFHTDLVLRRIVNYSLEIRSNSSHIESMMELAEKLESEVKKIREFAEKLNQ